MKVREQYQAATPRVKAILRRSREAATAKLRDRGWTDEQIARWFNKRDIALRRGAKDFKTPSLKKVVEIVSRSAPEDTLRRKAASRKLRRKIQAA
jgi:hypothetical protein